MKWQLLIEHSCPNCGCGFSSPNLDAHFCSRKCAPEAVAKRKLYTAAKNAVHRCLRGHGTFRLLNYTLADLKASIESKFQTGMSWTNYGLWEIDHLFPISKFPPGTPVSVINALDNLQPLWKTDNRKKHANVCI